VRSVSLCGIDVSLDDLTVRVERDGKQLPLATFPNHPDHHPKLCRWLTKGGKSARVCLEATGVYHLELALALHHHKRIEVMVVNPRAMRHHARARMQRGKTDPVDTGVILDYLKRMDFKPWTAPRQELLDLRCITRRIYQLNREIERESGRQHATAQTPSITAAINNDIQVNVRHLKARIKLLRAQALDIIRSDDRLRQMFQHLVSVRGIAQTSACNILAEIARLPDDMTAPQWVAYAGLDPVPFESGTKIKRRRISKQGNRYLRAALYMPALVAIRHEPHIKAFYEKLLDRGKEKMQAIVAVMRKLLHAIWAMLKKSQDFDGQKFYRLAA
jgi:transposase